jgi:hypothetical protein
MKLTEETYNNLDKLPASMLIKMLIDNGYALEQILNVLEIKEEIKEEIKGMK